MQGASINLVVPAHDKNIRGQAVAHERSRNVTSLNLSFRTALYEKCGEESHPFELRRK